jgi:hypothetical protein
MEIGIGTPHPLVISSFINVYGNKNQQKLGDLQFTLIERRGIVSFQTFQYFSHFLRIGNE